VSKLHTG